MTEAQEQEKLFQWAEYMKGTYPELELMHHIPNGGKRTPREAMKFKRMGVKPGIPDIFLPCARGCYHGLYIELKRPEGRASEAQGVMLAKLKEQGYYAVICKGFDCARKTIEMYMGGKHDAS